MSVLSKCFDHVLSKVNCHQIVHPLTSSCIHSAWNSLWKPVPTTAKFFLPFFLIPLASRRDKIDKATCREMVVTFLSAICVAFLTGTIGRWFMCILHNMLNHFTYYSIVCIPALLGSLVIFAASNKVAIMFAHSVFVMVLQVMITKGKFTFFRHISRSKFFRTVTFMLLSALLLDSMRIVKPNISWLLQPLKSRSRDQTVANGTNERSNGFWSNEKVCCHRSDCYEFNKKVPNLMQRNITREGDPTCS